LPFDQLFQFFDFKIQTFKVISKTSLMLAYQLQLHLLFFVLKKALFKFKRIPGAVLTIDSLLSTITVSYALLD
jgi:hypothetical protein